ncbi:MAG: DUF2867 domain-containing protein [Desulfobacteraceae bacterium]|nr:DUF2867 domain-containing protein [Desulfobacteraceae bacterium]
MEIEQYNSLPIDSIIARNYGDDIHYTDSFRMEFCNSEGLSVDYLATLFFTWSPGWVKILLSMRDAIAGLMGLKTGSLPEPSAVDKTIRYNLGEKLVYFSLIDRSDSEIVMAEDDKHLYFRTSVFIQKNPNSDVDSVFVATMVHFHNIWGRIYFAPVKPFHQLIIRRMLVHFGKIIRTFKADEKFK